MVRNDSFRSKVLGSVIQPMTVIQNKCYRYNTENTILVVQQCNVDRVNMVQELRFLERPAIFQKKAISKWLLLKAKRSYLPVSKAEWVRLCQH